MRRAAVVVLLLGALAAGSPPAGAQVAGVVEVSVTDLLEDPLTFADGTVMVRLSGELVGDYGWRSDGFMWTQLNDDGYARAPIVEGGPRVGANVGVGIRVPHDLAEGLDPVGGYRLRGPLVAVTGYWKYHDPDRGGESYLDVVELEVLEAGRRLEEGPDWWAVGIGTVLLAAAAVLWWDQRRRAAVSGAG